jgi:hypothetical protein
MVALLAGWSVIAFGWMAIAAVGATVLAYGFFGKRGAAVTGVLAFAMLFGWGACARNGSGATDRALTAKKQMAARKSAQRKRWKSWNRKAAAEENQGQSCNRRDRVDSVVGGGLRQRRPNARQGRELYVLVAERDHALADLANSRKQHQITCGWRERVMEKLDSVYA